MDGFAGENPSKIRMIGGYPYFRKPPYAATPGVTACVSPCAFKLGWLSLVNTRNVASMGPSKRLLSSISISRTADPTSIRLKKSREPSVNVCRSQQFMVFFHPVKTSQFRLAKAPNAQTTARSGTSEGSMSVALPPLQGPS